MQTWLLYHNALSAGVVIEDILKHARKSKERATMVDDSNSIIEMRTQLAEQERTIRMLLAARATGGDVELSERSSLLSAGDKSTAASRRGSAFAGSPYGSLDINVSVGEAAARAAAAAAVGQPKVVVRFVILLQSTIDSEPMLTVSTTSFLILYLLFMQSLKGAMKQTSVVPSSGITLTQETAPQITRANSDNLTSSGKTALSKVANSWDTSQSGDRNVSGGKTNDSSNVLNTLSTTPTPVASAKETTKPADGEFVFSQPSSMPPRG